MVLGHLFIWFVLSLFQKAYPGESVKIQAVALDQFNHTTSAFIGVETTKVSFVVVFLLVINFKLRLQHNVGIYNSLNKQLFGAYTFFRIFTCMHKRAELCGHPWCLGVAMCVQTFCNLANFGSSLPQICSNGLLLETKQYLY